MKIFEILDPFDYTFAQAGLRGTWEEGSGLCPECKSSPSTKRTQPLVIYWKPGSDILGDFTWIGTYMVMTEAVMNALLSRFSGFEAGPVEMIQDPKLRPPKRITKRTKPRIWLPYAGPTLYEVWKTSWVSADLARSTIDLVNDCTTCGTKDYRVEGLEKYVPARDLRTGELSPRRIPRVPGAGIFLRSRDLGGASIFGVSQLRGPTLCTEQVKAFIEEQQYTNVTFVEVGDVI